MLRLNTAFLAIILLGSFFAVAAQDHKPLTSQEVVSLLYQLQRNPDTRDELIEQIRKRGIGFALTDGMRSLVATKSGNDALLRRTLEEAGGALDASAAQPSSPSLPFALCLLDVSR